MNTKIEGEKSMITVIGLERQCGYTDSKYHTIAVTAIAVILILTLFPIQVVAEDEIYVQEEIVVGTIDVPPFAMKKPSGEWEGLSIELLDLIAKELEIDFKIQEYSSVIQIKDALTNGEIDLAPAAIMTESNELYVDYSHPFYRSGSAIVVKLEGEGYGWLGIAKYFATINFLKLIGFLFFSWMIAGTLVWLFENRHNSEMFGDKMVKGLGNGVWWAVVTMTTVGYGDKAPKTFGGRMVATCWMLASIILFSSFTAAITTSLTVGKLQGKVNGFNDLPNVHSGSLAYSPTLEYLERNGIIAKPFENIHEGLQAVADNRISAFIFDETVLKHVIKTEGFGQLRVLNETRNHYYVGMAVPTNSPLLEKLNRALLKVMEKEEWDWLLKKYLSLRS